MQEKKCFVKPMIVKKYSPICEVRELIRSNDFHYKYGIAQQFTSVYTLRDSDFAFVKCWSNAGERWSGKVFGIVIKLQLNASNGVHDLFLTY